MTDVEHFYARNMADACAIMPRYAYGLPDAPTAAEIDARARAAVAEDEASGRRVLLPRK